MKFNIHVRLKGPGGTQLAPVTQNPVEAESLAACLSRLSYSLPDYSKLGVEIVGVIVELVHEPDGTDPT